ncbi:hypothetical protein [Hymenobacter nivis]|uniref:hypothetical protein n=1 Tax=Hymenobacter nivis TaxID=1850093 RepID=UPI001B8648B1|nr:hypothetical protein [Hymenobacter nivis]
MKKECTFFARSSCLDRNRCLYHPDGSRRLADNALVALTLLIAESKPEDKATMVTLVVNLINQDN